MNAQINPLRVRQIRNGKQIEGPIVYWMSRDQRAEDNWALLYSQEKALVCRQPLIVAFNLVPAYLDAALRQYDFMLSGLEEVERKLRAKAIPFIVLTGDPKQTIPRFVHDTKASLLVTDFNPLRINQQWIREVSAALHIPMMEVDAHNIFPLWTASTKVEYGAYTLRPKIHRMMDEFLENFPALKRHPYLAPDIPLLQWGKIRKTLHINMDITPVAHWNPGATAARKALSGFLNRGLAAYDKLRNDPCVAGQSDLSPFLHFGHLSAQRAALEASEKQKSASFLEELIVRRELADNFCFYNPNYDSFEGFHPWAQKTLNEHRRDKREYVYSLEDFEAAKTHDPLWNACQLEMVTTGKMHGFMRMYWGKKILEWSESPEIALAIAIYLNDTYELDGRDPNGYTGIAWSIGGVHDRAWGERIVYGKIRYMNFNGCRRKFDVQKYILKYPGSEQGKP